MSNKPVNTTSAKAGIDRLWMVGPGVLRGVIHGQLPNKSNGKRMFVIKGRARMFQGDEVKRYHEQFEHACWANLRNIERLPDEAKLYFKAIVYQQNMMRDLDCELLPDIFQRFHLIENDRAFWKKDYERRLDRDNPRVEFEIGVWTPPGEVDLFSPRT